MADKSGHSKDIKKISGTREWAVAEINCCLGCPHDCLYCYARYDLVERKRVLTAEQWVCSQVNEQELLVERPLYPGQVMFPSAHDIIPENIEPCLTILKKLLSAGNKVLVVSKPHLDCIKRLCSEFSEERQQLLFRFTITARSNSILKLWEPFAPDYQERKACLQHTYNEGFATSVSVEPMLDTRDVVAMVHELLPFVSHSVWLGKMNKIDRRVRCESAEMRREIQRIERGQSDEKLLQLYQQLHSLPEIRWKESIKMVLGLEQAPEPGLDL